MTSTPSDPLLQDINSLSPAEPQVAPVNDAKIPSRRGVIWRRFLRQKQGMLGLVVLVLLVLAAYVGPYFDKWKYTTLDFNSFLVKPNGSHWFGTDSIGHDVFAQTMHGAQLSILIGLFVALLATGLAAVVGAAAGYFGGWTDRILMWIVDLLLVLPAFLIIAILSNQFASSRALFIILLAMFLWQITARIVRGQTLSLKDREYVLAAKYMGVSGWRIIGRHIMPNLASLLIIDATVNVSVAILTEASLSFFGFGIQPPNVSLGTLLSDNQNAAFTSPWLFYFPAGFLILLVLAVNLVGDGLRDAIDPSSGKQQ